eukprot:7720968-Alexandrium_andersonii.AAC.1
MCIRDRGERVHRACKEQVHANAEAWVRPTGEGAARQDASTATQSLGQGGTKSCSRQESRNRLK